MARKMTYQFVSHFKALSKTSWMVPKLWKSDHPFSFYRSSKIWADDITRMSYYNITKLKQRRFFQFFRKCIIKFSDLSDKVRSYALLQFFAASYAFNVKMNPFAIVNHAVNVNNVSYTNVWLYLRVWITCSCFQVKLVGVVWILLVQIDWWCLIPIGIRPMMIKQWQEFGEMARRSRSIFVLLLLDYVID